MCRRTQGLRSESDTRRSTHVVGVSVGRWISIVPDLRVDLVRLDVDWKRLLEAVAVVAQRELVPTCWQPDLGLRGPQPRRLAVDADLAVRCRDDAEHAELDRPGRRQRPRRLDDGRRGRRRRRKRSGARRRARASEPRVRRDRVARGRNLRPGSRRLARAGRGGCVPRDDCLADADPAAEDARADRDPDRPARSRPAPRSAPAIGRSRGSSTP